MSEREARFLTRDTQPIRLNSLGNVDVNAYYEQYKLSTVDLSSNDFQAGVENIALVFQAGRSKN